jgi:hypothetical protein
VFVAQREKPRDPVKLTLLTVTKDLLVARLEFS